MTNITAAILDLHCATQRLRSISAASRPAREVEAAAVRLVKAVATLQASAVAGDVRRLDPLQAVELVLEAAIAAGTDWQELVAVVTRAGQARH